MPTTVPSAKDLAEAASRIQQQADTIGLGTPTAAPKQVVRTWVDRYDELVTSAALRAATRALFADGHYARAVEEAYKCLNNEVKARSGLATLDGDSLMRKAFSANAPVLKLNEMAKPSENDEQRGYMDIYAGAMSGVRNPRAHEHDLEDPPEVALELIVLANHLMRRLETAKKSRPRRSRVKP